MKPWIRRTLIGVFGAAALLGGIGAYAAHEYGWHGDPAQMKRHMVERISGRLELNDTQKARLGVLADALMAQRQALHGSDPKAEMQAVIAGPAFDRTRAEALLSSKIAALQSGGPAVLTAMADFYDSLDPAQQVKVRAFVAEHHGHRMHGERDGQQHDN
ncbi:MAG: Spy/CpxP family protein refolding chaperone [Proteobacteria bacterium]|nr:Spy/CpxP family protein refolding chaperone [Pseudomonadota bacterium]